MLAAVSGERVIMCDSSIKTLSSAWGLKVLVCCTTDEEQEQGGRARTEKTEKTPSEILVCCQVLGVVTGIMDYSSRQIDFCR